MFIIILFLLLFNFNYAAKKADIDNESKSQYEQYLDKIHRNILDPDTITTYLDSLRAYQPLVERSVDKDYFSLFRMFRIGGQITIEEDQRYSGKLFTFFSDVQVKGEFNGMLFVLFGKIALHEEAFLNGTLIKLFSRLEDLRKQDIFGLSIIEFPFSNRQIKSIPVSMIRYIFVLILIIACLINIRFRKPLLIQTQRNLVKTPFSSILLGITGSLMIIPTFLLLLIVIIGIPFTVILMFFCVWSMFIGYLAIVNFVAEFIKTQFKLKINHYILVTLIIISYEFWPDVFLLAYRFIPSGSYIETNTIIFEKILDLSILVIGFGAFLMNLKMSKFLIAPLPLKKNAI